MAEAAEQPLESGLHEALLSRVHVLREYVRRKIPPRFRPVISADDVLQDVWLAAYRTFSNFHSECPDGLDRWLMTLTTTKLASAMRTARCLKRGGNQRFVRDTERRLTSCASLFARLRSPGKTPSSEVHTAEAGHLIMILLNELNDEQRKALELRYIEGLPNRKIAQALSKSESAINSLLFNARRQMRQLLGPAARYFSDVPSCAGEDHERSASPRRR